LGSDDAKTWRSTAEHEDFFGFYFLLSENNGVEVSGFFQKREKNELLLKN
jgi:hypothetical protein